MSKISTEFETTLDIDNHKLEVSIIVEGRFTKESYGNDYDNNRGIVTTELDEMRIEIYDKRNNNISDKLLGNVNYESLIKDIIELSEKKLLECYYN
jgi:hypothetical protein